MRKTWLLVATMLLGFQLAIADPANTGQVQGPDSTNPGVYVITMPADLKISPRDIVRIERNGSAVTDAVVQQVQVDRITVRPKDTKSPIQEGDSVVYVGPPAPTVGVPGGAAPKPRTMQPGLHVDSTLAGTFTDDAGYWACNVMVENNGDEGALVAMNATFVAPNGDHRGCTHLDGSVYMKPGDTKIFVLESGFKSPYGQRNDQSDSNGIHSDWSTSSSVSNDITSVEVNLLPNVIAQAKPRT